MKQHSEETTKQFYIRLKEQSPKCNFTAADREIKQQIELNTLNNKLIRFSFRNPTKTLAELLLEGKTLENTKLQSEEIEKVATREETVDAVRKTQHKPGKNFTERKMSKLLCFKCGGDFPHTGNCPAKDKQ